MGLAHLLTRTDFSRVDRPFCGRLAGQMAASERNLQFPNLFLFSGCPAHLQQRDR